MDDLMRRSRHPDKYRHDLESGKTQEQILQDKFGDASLTWAGLAAHAEYVHGLLSKKGEASWRKSSQEDLNKMMNFMASAESGQAEEIDSDLTRESLFRSITRQRYDASSAEKKEDVVLGQIESMMSI